MIIFVALVLTLLTFAFIVYPFYQRRLQPVEPGSDEGRRELYSNRDTAYSMLKELEFDYQSGLLSEEDYRDLEARYKKKAISILMSMDNLAKSSDIESEIEKQVLALRQKKGKPEAAATSDEIEKEVLALRQRKGRFCPQCGAASQESDRFCAACGAKLREV